MSLCIISKNKESTLGNTGYNKITDLLPFWLCFTLKVSEPIYNYKFDKFNCQNLVIIAFSIWQHNMTTVYWDACAQLKIWDGS